MPKHFAWPTMNEHLNNSPLPAVLDCICGNADLECEPVNEKLMDTRWQVRCYCGVRGAYGDGIKEAIDKWNVATLPVESPSPAPHQPPAANAAVVARAEIAGIEPMTPRRFAEIWYAGGPESEAEETARRIDALAAMVEVNFTPRLPMADEGQGGYTESEVQEIIARSEQRVFRALSKALGGPGWKWLPETRRKLTRQVRKAMSKMGKRPEVSNV